MRITIVAISLAGFLTSLPSAVRGSEEARVKPTSPPAIPAGPKTGIDLFRELLSMSPAERKVAFASRQDLTSRSEKSRQVITARLEEFDKLQPDEREVRLERMKLRTQLLPLLSTPPAQRQLLTASLPEADRQALQDRLQLWDQLPPELQKQVLENEGMLNCIMPVQTVSSNQLNRVMLSLPAADREKIASNWNRFQQIPLKDREKMYDNFRDLFDLSDSERSKLLSRVSESERQQMERTLKDYQRLPKPQRDQCLASFQKFANMTAFERAQFLHNAELWKAMTTNERESWRNLVNKFPPMPPTPPGMRVIPE